MSAQPKRHFRPLEEDRAPQQEEAPAVDRDASEPEGSAPNEYVSRFLSLVTQLERNWALSAALILAAIIVASVL